MKKFSTILFLLTLAYTAVCAQRVITANNETLGPASRSTTRSADNNKKTKKEDAPIGLRTWTVSRFNDIDSCAIDTFSHQFHKENYTEGITGRYNSLGNMGSPRQSRIFTDRPGFNYFIFAQPYDFFLKPFETFHFTNTLSPITNITYHETTSSDDGEDHIHAKYAINIDKTAGIGFHLNYLYGRGYYSHQQTSQFGATLYGSVIKDKYQAHVRLFSNYLKSAENGGITDDDFVSHPEKFPSSFDTKDIPTNLDRVWNRMYINGGELTHSYSLGFHRVKEGQHVTFEDSVRLKLIKGKALAARLLADSLRKDSLKTKVKHPAEVAPVLATADSISQDSTHALAAAPKVLRVEELPEETKDTLPQIDVTFVPVTSFIHTLQVYSNQRTFTAKEDMSHFFTNDFYQLTDNNTFDKIRNVQVSNLFAIELREGFNKWAVSGLRLFVQHDFNHYALPLTPTSHKTFNENRVTLGGMLLRRQGKYFNYNLLGQTSSDGDSWGEFEVKGSGNLNLPLWGDTINLNVYGAAVNQRPTFFYRHFQSRFEWWDNDNLDNQFTTRIGAVLSSKRTKTRLSVDFQNIKNYTYFGTTYTPTTIGSTAYNTMSASVNQANSNIQVFTASLNQDFRFGILNWENEIVYQKSSKEEVLPLPDVSLYTNLYLLFRIAKVLRVEFGGDMRYFTSYYAPTYNPALGMFANQPSAEKIKVGNYPIIDIYANFHLKHTRFYVMYSHINYSNDGSKSFRAPHYPANPGMLKLGLSWNFFN